MVIPAFEEATGIKIELVSAGTGECVERIDAEKENPQADVLWGGMNYGVYVQHPDLWADYTSPNESLIDEACRQGDVKCYTNYMLSGSGALIINNKLQQELGFEVNGYADLLNPVLKGKIASGDPTKSSSAWAELTNMLLVMGDEAYDEKAWEYVEQFVAQLDGIQLDSFADTVSFVIFPAVFLIAQGRTVWTVLIAIAYVFAGVTRLCWFDITTDGNTKYFSGFPVTCIALFLPLWYAVAAIARFTVPTLAVALTLLVMAVLFVANIRVKKPSGKATIVLAVIGLAMLLILLLVR